MWKLKLICLAVLLLFVCACSGNLKAQPSGRYVLISNPLTQKVEVQIALPNAEACQLYMWNTKREMGDEFSEVNNLFKCSSLPASDVLNYSAEVRLAGAPDAITVKTRERDACTAFTDGIIEHDGFSIKEECSSMN